MALRAFQLRTLCPDLAIQVACQHFTKWPSPSRTHSLTTADIPYLLEFCLNATYFAFRYFLYQQVHGTAMSSLVSVVVADLVTSMWLWLQTVPSLEVSRGLYVEDLYLHSLQSKNTHIHKSKTIISCTMLLEQNPSVTTHQQSVIAQWLNHLAQQGLWHHTRRLFDMPFENVWGRV